MVQNALDGWNLRDLDFSFIENVGNLVCPSYYDLGEDLRFVLLSVTDGCQIDGKRCSTSGFRSSSASRWSCFCLRGSAARIVAG